jgi:hypothetical protein
MKEFIVHLLIFSGMLSKCFCSDNPTNIENSDYLPKKYHNISADATSTAIGVSMVGWGVGLAAVVTTLAILIPPDEESNSHSHCSSK